MRRPLSPLAAIAALALAIVPCSAPALAQVGAAAGEEPPFALVEGPLPEATPPAAIADPIDLEAEVDAALDWLKASQQPDGSWKSPGGDHDVAATSLALLAFMGGGHTHRFGDYKRTVHRGLGWLQARSEGGVIGLDPAVPGSMLDQSLAAIALAEAYAISRDRALKPQAQAAVAALERARDDGWGWGGEEEAPNTLATSFAVIGLKAGRVAGVDVFDRSFQKASALYRAATDADGVVGYRRAGDGVALAPRGEAGARVPLFTAAATIGRIFCGERKTADAVQAGASVLEVHAPSAEEVDLLYWYFGTYAMFQLGDEPWARWVGPMRDALLPLQEKGGQDAGSFAPSGVIGAVGGRVGSTAIAALTLQIYWRWERFSGGR